MDKTATTEKVAIITLGCEKNLVDSDIMSQLIDERGYLLVDDPQKADVVIVNTCGFIDAAKEESINTILEVADLKEHGNLKSLIVAGCLTQRYKEVLMQEMPEIDGIVGTGDFDKITRIIEESLEGKKPVFVGNPVFSYENATRRRVEKGTYSAYIKIAEGCDNKCTFCIIPQLRGAFRSRTIESIVDEAKELAAQGVKEVNLIAQDSTNYGFDIYGERVLHKLLRKVSEVEGIEWIRLHYAYPGYFTDELIQEFATNPKVCKYIDMPLQHSEDRVLKRMLRPGRQRDVRELIAKIRSAVPDVALRTSIIVGFPGETEEEFENLKAFLREIQFDRLGVFTYSQEEGTAAARLPEQIPADIIERRANELMEVQREVASERNGRFVGKVISVLIEAYDGKNDVYIGRSQYDASEIDGEVFVTGYKGELGQIVPVRITHSYDFDLAGEVI
ncbi:ribosomal protein S12 methylthiotransferase [Aneurinibacillus thermoaerophilus]|uniref:Ribosomal protein uS12 methylthiotransferase RimO n=2 Tax=Aneurinibacillus thermoaerophilus TaxID=143495 RepID=A0A1G8AFA5_ANETH|nr:MULTISPECIES: 30S ribosomal protein S12 methylthiotransferase RimO [Aneurinibacillus]AMA73513.1 ribosomal protein S12 methylthiotransferase RimO [Aneurinibacillus sp. XH2]MED0676700.1 30S ribosomal protein S12 methylthiotransferase RimO [Aneurinibacillus thermoaerophilus]QYY43910.1 30S ribosomal protein S12 methylthiotransferase RimO [Aneurinibacillus thermoaerophilus]SDH19557.1 ribosomal protein S12 methylthiotransferase [Aneurinibacillus thermoaerophilus]